MNATLILLAAGKRLLDSDVLDEKMVIRSEGTDEEFEWGGEALNVVIRKNYRIKPPDEDAPPL